MCIRDRVGARRAAGGPDVAVSVAALAGAGLRRPLPGDGAAVRGHDRAPRVHSRALVAAPAPQPDRAAPQGRAAVPPARGRRGRALPPSRLTGRAATAPMTVSYTHLTLPTSDLV